MWWFYQALATGPIAVVSLVTAVLAAGIPVTVGIALGERPAGLAGPPGGSGRIGCGRAAGQ